MVTCAVPSCCNNTNKNKKHNVTFHSFPLNNPTQLEKWLLWIRRLKVGEKWEPTQWSKICSEHFTPDCFTETKSVRRLKNDATPTLSKKTGVFGDDAAAKILLSLKSSDRNESEKADIPTKKIKLLDEYSFTSQSTNEFGEASKNETLEEDLAALEQEVNDTLSMNWKTDPPMEEISPVTLDHQYYCSPHTKIPDKDFQAPSYKKNGGCVGLLQSFQYSFHIIMLLVLKAVERNYNFRIASEYEIGGKFDDVYFYYHDNEKEHHLFFNIKHSVASADIILSDLLSDKRGKSGKLNLRDFFLSFMNLPPLNGEVMCILFTNRDICYGNTMKNISLEPSKFKDIELKYPDIFSRELLQFRDRNLYHHLIDFTSSTEEYVSNFLHQFYLAVGQYDNETLRNLIKSELKCKYQCNDREVNNIYYIFRSWIEDWYQINEGTYLTDNIVKNFLSKMNLVLQTKILEKIKTMPSDCVTNFCNRKLELSLLTKVLREEKDVNIIDVDIVGPSGVGKTQLVLKYINENSENFNHVIWINANTSSTVHESFLNLAKSINIIDKDDVMIENKLTMSKIYSWFKSESCLFVFDDCFNYEHIVKYLPNNPSENFRFILTSQYTTWRSNLSIQLKPFSEGEAIAFLTKELDKDLSLIDATDMKKACEKLGYLPLALQLASTYIKHQISFLASEKNESQTKSYTLNDFVCELNTNMSKIVHHSKSDHDKMLQLWTSMLDYLKTREYGEVAIDLLKIIAYMDDSEIPLSIFTNSPSYKYKGDLNEAIFLLKQFSLIEETDNNCISINSILQNTLIEKCNENDLKHTLELLAFHFEYNLILVKSIKKHCIRAWNHASKSESIVKQFKNIPILILNHSTCSESSILVEQMEKLSIDDNELSALKYKQAKILFKNWKCEDALKLCDEILTKTKDNDSNSFNCKKLKAKIFARQENFEEALKQYCDICSLSLSYYDIEHLQFHKCWQDLINFMKLTPKLDPQVKINELRPLLEILESKRLPLMKSREFGYLSKFLADIVKNLILEIGLSYLENGDIKHSNHVLKNLESAFDLFSLARLVDTTTHSPEKVNLKSQLDILDKIKRNIIDAVGENHESLNRVKLKEIDIMKEIGKDHSLIIR